MQPATNDLGPLPGILAVLLFLAGTSWGMIIVFIRLRLRWFPLSRVALQDAYRFLGSCERFGAAASEGAAAVARDLPPPWQATELARLASGLGEGKATVLVNDPMPMRVEVPLLPAGKDGARIPSEFWNQVADGYAVARRQWVLVPGFLWLVLMQLSVLACYFLLAVGLRFGIWAAWDSPQNPRPSRIMSVLQDLGSPANRTVLGLLLVAALLALALVVVAASRRMFDRIGIAVWGRRLRVAAMRADMAALAGQSRTPLPGGWEEGLLFPSAQARFLADARARNLVPEWAAATGRSPALDLRVPLFKWSCVFFLVAGAPGFVFFCYLFSLLSEWS